MLDGDRARWASGRRLPAIRYLRTREPSTVACRSVGPGSMWSARRATHPRTPTILPARSGCRDARSSVLTRRNAVTEAQGSPIRRSPVELRGQPRHGALVLGRPHPPRRAAGSQSISISAGPGRSSCSSAPPMFETSMASPSPAVRWRNGGAFGRATRPARTRVLTASLRPMDRSRRTRSTAAATSSSARPWYACQNDSIMMQ